MTASIHTSPQARQRLKKRYAAERRFRAFGFTALSVAFGFLAFFLINITRQALPAFFQHYVIVSPDFSTSGLSPNATPAEKSKADFDTPVRASLSNLFPQVTERAHKRALNALLSSGAPIVLRNAALSDAKILQTGSSVPLLLSDNADLYLKNGGARLLKKGDAGFTFVATGTQAQITSVDTENFDGAGDVLKAGGTVFLMLQGGTFKLTDISGVNASATILISPENTIQASSGPWSIKAISQPEADRNFKDNSAALIENLKDRDLIEKRLSREFFTLGASREAEMAGVFSALIGSMLTLIVTLLASFPISVAAAIYLEQFAPKNRITEIIEVNINNLAAVPSIIFGLLGLAVFLNVFGMPRSAPIVGGLVLALMTMPIIIIASRAALRSVPPSVKEAALGLGASHMQAVFHHVLPLAVPGILTGTILGTARALGETAPLLLIGMVAFVVDAPKGFGDASTLLPVQIFMWNDFPEIAFQQKTAAAILVLLVFLGLMNLGAVLLRRRFEQRW